MTFLPTHPFTVHFPISRFGRLACLVLSLSSLLLPYHAQAGINQWTTNGPTGQPAEVTTLAIDPQTPTTLYAGTFQGVFKSEDGAESWTLLNTSDLGLSFINTLSIDPLTPSTLYAGTFGRVFKSTDAGMSWTPSDNSLEEVDVSRLVIDLQLPETLYAGTSGGVFKSVDGGVSWTAMNTGLGDFPSVQVLALDPQTPQTLYTATFNGLFKSTDGGQSWVHIAQSVVGLSSVSVLALDPNTPTTVYAGGNGGLFKTIDGGGSWSPMNTGLTTPTLQALVLDPDTPTTLYLGTFGGGIFKSSDGAASWTSMSSGLPDFASIRVLAIDPLTPANVYSVVLGSSIPFDSQPLGGVFKTIDAGQSWSARNTGLGRFVQVSTIAVDPEDPLSVYAGTFEGLFKTTDGGGSWFPINDGITGSVFLPVLRGYLGFHSFPFITAFTFDPQTSTTVYVGVGNQVFRSLDGGLHWTPLGSGLPEFTFVTALAIDPQTPTTLYAGLSGNGVFKSVDNGATWTAMNTGFFFDTMPVTVLAIDPSAPATLYAGTSTSGIFRSTNGGESWQSMSNGFPSPSVQALAIDPQTPSTLYAGTAQSGIVKSTDGGSSWTLVNTGLPLFISATAVSIDPVIPTTLYAGISGHGVFKSIDGGANWTAMNPGLSDLFVSSLAIDTTGTTLYSGTFGGAFAFQLEPEIMENPQDGSFQSGAGVVSGWVCDAELVTIEIDGSLVLEAAYGTSRADTVAVCGDSANGFGLLLNWNILGDGPHDVRALADGEEFGRATVTVTTLGTEFLSGASGSFSLSDFPQAGTDVEIVWQETLQNFVIADLHSAALSSEPPSHIASQPLSMGVLENPQANAFQSGIGVVSGWLCEAEQVEIEIDGLIFEAAYGTSRNDTQAVCGDTNNGFGLLVNWNLFGDGPHDVRALADGEELGRVSVEVTTFGQEFLTNVEGSFTLSDFPQPGSSVEVEWHEALQNFVITDFQSDLP